MPMRFLKYFSRSFVIAGFLVGCANSPVDVETPRTIPLISPPTGADSAQPNLSIDSTGQIYLTWIEPVSDSRDSLKFAVLESNKVKWSDARIVADGSNWFVNWADFPSVVPLTKGRLAAHWLAKTGPATYAYSVNIALSDDDGQTWSHPILPHSDGTETEHGFVSMIPTADGSLSVVWLDGREMAETSGSGNMSLMHALINPQGSVLAETVLDSRVCECCQTSTASIPGGQLVFYRDRSEDELRDIAMVRYQGGLWSEPKTLSRDGWRILGCPVNGPSVSISNEIAAVSWFTATNEEPSVWLMLSSDTGETFSKRLRIDDGNPLGRVEVLALPSSVFVTWMEQTEDGAEVRLKQVNKLGSVVGFWTVANTNKERSSGFPQLVGNSDRLVLAWTEAGKPSRVRTAIMSSRDFAH